MKQGRKKNVSLGYRMMSMQQMDVSPMDLLCERLKSNFPEIRECSATAGNEFFWITIAEETKDAPFMKAFDSFVKPFIEAYGDRETGYDFRIGRERELVNIISYNQDRGHLVDVKLEGRMQSVFVVDVQGATGDFTVFDDDFNIIGYMCMRETGAPVEEESEEERPFPDFSDCSLWQASNSQLGSVLHQIIAQIAAQMAEGDAGSDKDFGGGADE